MRSCQYGSRTSRDGIALRACILSNWQPAVEQMIRALPVAEFDDATKYNQINHLEQTIRTSVRTIRKLARSLHVLLQNDRCCFDQTGTDHDEFRYSIDRR